MIRHVLILMTIVVLGLRERVAQMNGELERLYGSARQVLSP
jgi:hypothetical protein